MTAPTIIEQPSEAQIEAARAKHWRKQVMGLTRPQLAALIGYSVPAIQFYERGYSPTGKPFGQRFRRRYRMACAAAAAALQGWQWDGSNGQGYGGVAGEQGAVNSAAGVSGAGEAARGAA